MGIVSEKLSQKVRQIEMYKIANNLDFFLSPNDATTEELKTNTVPFFEIDNKKMGKSDFFKVIGKVEDKKFEKKSENEYTLKGKINIGYTGDKWNPEPVYKDYNLTFKCWNYSFDGE